MEVCENLTESYRVEVSGWDEDNIFFVEKANLAWDDKAGKHVVLRHRLPSVTMVFLRLMQSVDSRRTCPVAYSAELIGQNPGGLYQFRLTPAAPRQPTRNRMLN